MFLWRMMSYGADLVGSIWHHIYIHTHHIHTYTRKRIHTHMHTHTQAHTYTCTYTHPHIHVHTHTHTGTHTYTHNTQMHTRTRACKHKCKDITSFPILPTGQRSDTSDTHGQIYHVMCAAADIMFSLLTSGFVLSPSLLSLNSVPSFCSVCPVSPIATGLIVQYVTSAATRITWQIRPGLPPLFVLQATKAGHGGLGTRLGQYSSDSAVD